MKKGQEIKQMLKQINNDVKFKKDYIITLNALQINESNTTYPNLQITDSADQYNLNDHSLNNLCNKLEIGTRYDEHFEELWNKLKIKRGSKFKAFQEYWKLDKHTGCTVADLFNADELSKIYNSQQQGVENKFIPHFSTWLSQIRWEMENENNPIPDLIDRLINLGYVHKGTDGNFELFNKDGKDYKIDIFDDKHQMQLIQ